MGDVCALWVVLVKSQSHMVIRCRKHPVTWHWWKLNMAINILCESLPCYLIKSHVTVRQESCAVQLGDRWMDYDQKGTVGSLECLRELQLWNLGIESWLCPIIDLTFGTLLSSAAKWDQYNRSSNKVKIHYMMCINTFLEHTTRVYMSVPGLCWACHCGTCVIIVWMSVLA